MSNRVKMLLPVVGVLVIFACAAAAVVREAGGGLSPTDAAYDAAPTPFGGTFEASAVAHVPGTDGVLCGLEVLN